MTTKAFPFNIVIMIKALQFLRLCFKTHLTAESIDDLWTFIIKGKQCRGIESMLWMIESTIFYNESSKLP